MVQRMAALILFAALTAEFAGSQVQIGVATLREIGFWNLHEAIGYNILMRMISCFPRNLSDRLQPRERMQIATSL